MALSGHGLLSPRLKPGALRPVLVRDRIRASTGMYGILGGGLERQAVITGPELYEISLRDGCDIKENRWANVINFSRSFL